MPKGKFQCQVCGTWFERYVSPSRGEPKYCSYACSNRSRSLALYATCPQCGKEFRKKRSHQKFCSRECVNLHRRHHPESYHYHRLYHWTEEQNQLIVKAYRTMRATEALDFLNAHRAFKEIPFWAIKERAVHLGVAKTVPGQAWTEEEDRILFDHIGTAKLKTIQNILKAHGYHRSIGGIASRCRYLGYSTKYQGSLNATQVAEAIGCSTSTVLNWIKRGRLQARHPGGEGMNWEISEIALKRFISENPYEVAKFAPDIVWLIGLLTSKSV